MKYFFAALLVWLQVVNTWSQIPNKITQYIDNQKITQKTNLPISDYYVARFLEAPRSDAGVRLWRQLDSRHGIVTLASGEYPTADLEWVAPANTLWKCAPTLRPEQGGRFILIVQDAVAFRQYLREQTPALAILQEYPAVQAFEMELPDASALSSLLACPQVVFVDRANREPQEELAINGFDLSANCVNLAQRSWPWLDGHNLTVSIKENRFDERDLDLIGRTVPSAVASSFTTSHATFMATIVGGAGNTFYTGRGVAPAVHFSMSDFRNLMPDNHLENKELNISVQNHSYGVGLENYYGADAAAYDAQVQQHPHLLHVFSAGNRGNLADTLGTYAGLSGYANLTGSFKMSKNTLTVGAMDSLGFVPLLSSKGPTYDGRVKPELVAYGLDGSSGAAALTSGVALLLQQAYRAQYGDLPAAALLKALLINSADDVDAPGIDYRSGYGRLNAWRALRNLYAGNWQTSNVQNAENKTITISLPANARRLKVTLAWSDAPAPANAARALVNDLDLELYHRANGRSWRPWVLNSFPHPDSLMQLSMRARDSLNNVEQITLEDPASGDYDIRVHGYDVSTPEQLFSLSWQWDTLGHMQWLFPAAGDYVLPNTRFAVRWEAIEAGTTARLEYSINGGASWLPAVEQVTLEAGYVHWVAPPVQSKALLRLVDGEHTWQSDTFFIAPPMELKVGFNCSDSILLFWKTKFYENKYLLYELGERYLQPIATLSDTFVVLPKAQYPGLHYAIAPILPHGSIGQKSYTINYTTQGVDCYWRTFFANVRAGQAVLQLSLGTLYQVVGIAWERQEGADFVTLHTMQPDGRLELEWIDHAPRTGRNVYRARLIFQNGTVSYSDSATLFFAQPQAHLVFPNPVRAGELLTILYGTPQEGLFFVLYDALGREYQRQPLSDIRSDILLSSLPAGTFFYQIRQGLAVHGSGKIVVLP
jgi:hypothetical protein